MREKIEENGRGAVSLTGEIVLAGSLEQSRPFVKASAGNYYICRKSGNLYSPGENNGLLFSIRPVEKISLESTRCLFSLAVPVRRLD